MIEVRSYYLEIKYAIWKELISLKYLRKIQKCSPLDILVLLVRQGLSDGLKACGVVVLVGGNCQVPDPRTQP